MSSPAPTGQFQEDLQRGSWDIPFWSERFLGVKMHPGQIRFANAVRARNKTLWRAAYLTICCSAGNRAGKTLALAIVILHSIFYKIGTKPPADSSKDLERWMKAEYVWYHFGIRQEISELVFWELVKLATGVHEAQHGGDGCPLSNEIPDWASWDKKYQGEYRWFVLSPLFGGGQIHFRTTMEKALGTLGRDMHGISYDECGFDTNLDFVIGEVLDLRRLGTGGQLLLVSTPTEGLTSFADVWETGNPEAPDRKPNRYSVRMSTRENVGYGLDRTMFERVVSDMPQELVPQNIDGYFIEGRTNYFSALAVDRAFDAELQNEKEAIDGHHYVQGVDAATTYDSTYSVVLDCSNVERVVGVKITRLRGRQSTDSIVALTSNTHNAYNVSKPGLRTTCSTAIDATGWGGKMFREALDATGMSPLRNIEFGGTRQKKLKMLGDVKTMLDQGKIVFPRSEVWLSLRRQLAGYKLADRKMETDAVMALVCAVAEARRHPGSDATSSVPFDPFGGEGGVPVSVPDWLKGTIYAREAS